MHFKLYYFKLLKNTAQNHNFYFAALSVFLRVIPLPDESVKSLKNKSKLKMSEMLLCFLSPCLTVSPAPVGIFRIWINKDPEAWRWTYMMLYHPRVWLWVDCEKQKLQHMQIRLLPHYKNPYPVTPKTLSVLDVWLTIELHFYNDRIIYCEYSRYNKSIYYAISGEPPTSFGVKLLIKAQLCTNILWREGSGIQHQRVSCLKLSPKPSYRDQDFQLFEFSEKKKKHLGNA